MVRLGGGGGGGREGGEELIQITYQSSDSGRRETRISYRLL